MHLLAEKRRALVAHAVTRGLDPNVPLRDSGVPWLGPISAHWKAVPLRFAVRFIGGATPDKGNLEYWSGPIPWVSPKDMKMEEISDSEDHVSEAALSNSSLQMIPANSLLIVVRGMILAHSFPVAITKAEVTINQDMKALRCQSNLEPEFLRAVFQGLASIVVRFTDESAHGTKRLDSEVLGRLLIPLPELPEQRAIVAHVAEKAAALDALRVAAERTISLLKERRAALIAAAVTGRISIPEAA
ncbi:MAG: restriction endonuclease subunit S [Bryobacteraceae bacterium]